MSSKPAAKTLVAELLFQRFGQFTLGAVDGLPAGQTAQQRRDAQHRNEDASKLPWAESGRLTPENEKSAEEDEDHPDAYKYPGKTAPM